MQLLAGLVLGAILRLDLAEVRRDQDRAWRPLGPVEVTAAFSEKPGLVIRARLDGREWSFHQAELAEGRDVGGHTIVWENGLLRAGGEQVFAMDLVRALYQSCVIVRLGVVDYAVIKGEDSISFLRRDDGGRYYVAYRPAAQLRQIDWLLAVNGTMYGVRLEGATLAFYSKPVPVI